MVRLCKSSFSFLVMTLVVAAPVSSCCLAPSQAPLSFPFPLSTAFNGMSLLPAERSQCVLSGCQRHFDCIKSLPCGLTVKIYIHTTDKTVTNVPEPSLALDLPSTEDMPQPVIFVLKPYFFLFWELGWGRVLCFSYTSWKKQHRHGGHIMLPVRSCGISTRCFQKVSDNLPTCLPPCHPLMSFR